MSERAKNRAAGATRLPAQPRNGQADLLATVDVTGWTSDQLNHALGDRGLATTGTLLERQTRLVAAVAAVYAAGA